MGRRLRAIISIDPGRSGAIVLAREDRKHEYIHNRRSSLVYETLKRWNAETEVVRVTKEAVGGWRGDTPATAFGLGNALGRVEGVVYVVFGIEANDIEEIHADVWQKFHKVLGGHYPAKDRGRSRYWKEKAKHANYHRTATRLGYDVPIYAATAALMADMVAKDTFQNLIWRI